LKLTGTALEIKTDANTTALSASAAGLEMKGKIRATSGDIGGFSITETAISSSNNKLRLKSNGQITASAMSMSGAVVATSGEIGGFRIGTDLDSTSGELKLKGASGQITASAVSMSGTIVASSGNVGGFIIDSSEVRSSNNNLRLKSNGQITADSGQIATFSITSGSIESSANAKRGLKLEPGDSIRGYGNVVHTTETVQGKFSFVEGATISPPAGTTVRWSTDLSVAAAPVERSTN